MFFSAVYYTGMARKLQTHLNGQSRWHLPSIEGSSLALPLPNYSAGCSNYSPQPFRVQASSPHHFAPALDLQQVGTVVMRDPAHHLSDPGPSNQFLYGASHFQLQQQHFSSTSTTLQPPGAATPSPNICHQPLSHRQPAGTNPHYEFRAPYVSQQATQGSWHSGYSPYRYELIELPSKV